MKKQGFTLVELLVVIAIIGLLISLLMPALGQVRIQARVTGMKSTFHAISTGLETFKGEFKEYPSSERRSVNGTEAEEYALREGGKQPDKTKSDIGAHRLAEAMFGLDRLGYDNKLSNGVPAYKVSTSTGKPVDWYNKPVKRWGPYVDTTKKGMETSSLLEIKDKINNQVEVVDAAGAHTAIAIPANINGEQDDKAWSNPNPVFVDSTNTEYPSPVIYFRAKLTGNFIHQIYDFKHNSYILNAYKMTRFTQNYADMPTSTYDPTGLITPKNLDLKKFESYLWDTKTGLAGSSGSNPTAFQSVSARPVNRDSYILMSAGPDGEFGTGDDITNFERPK